MERSLAELEVDCPKPDLSACARNGPSRGMRSGAPSSCALFRLFPQVAQAIQSVNSDDIQPYIEAIRRNVCSVCTDQEPDGSCETRQQVHCALDAYLLLVVDAIEEATGKTFDRQRSGSGGDAAVQSGPEIRL